MFLDARSYGGRLRHRKRIIGVDTGSQGLPSRGFSKCKYMIIQNYQAGLAMGQG